MCRDYTDITFELCRESCPYGLKRRVQLKVDALLPIYTLISISFNIEGHKSYACYSANLVFGKLKQKDSKCIKI